MSQCGVDKKRQKREEKEKKERRKIKGEKERV
jgi:hypothetical protein